MKVVSSWYYQPACMPPSRSLCISPFVSPTECFQIKDQVNSLPTWPPCWGAIQPQEEQWQPASSYQDCREAAWRLTERPPDNDRFKGEDFKMRQGVFSISCHYIIYYFLSTCFSESIKELLPVTLPDFFLTGGGGILILRFPFGGSLTITSEITKVPSEGWARDLTLEQCFNIQLKIWLLQDEANFQSENFRSGESAQ